MLLVTGEGLLALLLIGALLTSWAGTPAEHPDRRTLWEYAVLIVVLAAMTRIPVPLDTLQ